MGRWLIGVVVGLVAVTAIARAAQVREVDVEGLLAGRFGFTAAEVAQARSGQAVAKLLPTQDAGEVGVVGAVRVDARADRLVAWIEDVANFRKAAQLGFSRRLSDPPQIGDFADLSLDAGELSALRACRPGNCDLRIGDKAMARVQAEVNWAAPDAAQRANGLIRQLMLGYAQAYLAGGDAALGALHNEKAPRVRADEFRQVLSQSKAVYEIAQPLAAYLEEFPSARLAGSRQFLYWGKGGAGSEASISLHQLVIYNAPGGEVFIADKQLYASRYVDAALVLVSLASPPGGMGFYALVGARARSTMLGGMGARLLRGTVERATRDAAEMYLDWIRASFAL